jgi:hypothetical protein
MTQLDASLMPHDAPKITAVTRRDIFDYLRGAGGSWWGRLDEVSIVEALYDLDGLPSNDTRFPTARGDVLQHRVNNPEDWYDDWIFEDSRFQLAHGSDTLLLAFLVQVVRPEVLSDVDQASRHVDELNRLLAPDGWTLRAYEFLSGRPIYTPVRTQATGPLISLPLNDDASKLDLILGQVYSLLD